MGEKRKVHWAGRKDMEIQVSGVKLKGERRDSEGIHFLKSKAGMCFVISEI